MSRPLRPTDSDYSDRIQRLLNNVDDDDELSGSSSEEVDDSDADPDYVLPNEEALPRTRLTSYSESDPGTDDEQMVLEEESEEETNILPDYYVDRMKKTEFGPPNAWSSKAPTPQVRVPERNIIRTGLPGIRGRARLLGNNPTKADVWKLLFDDEIITQVVENTNVKLGNVREKLGEKTGKSNYRDTDHIEMTALIGLLMMSSVLRSNDEKITSLFTKDPCSRPVFSATMSEKRYGVLIACLRFDDCNTRAERRENDKAAPISEIFNKFISNSQRIYCVSSETTVDEMLIPFRGRCAFKVYMPNKPKKYGVKVMCLADAKTSYLLNAYIYSGKDSDGATLTDSEKKLSVPTQALLHVCKPIEGSNRNVTADNWFTSIEAIDELSKRKLTYVGTVRKDKKMVPAEFLPSSERAVGSTLYGFRGQITLISFVPKKNRAVLLTSTMHHSVQTDETKKKPEIICYYNKQKCGVDLLDMKCAIFTCNRKTRRWPLAVFYRMLNIGCVNSFIAYLSYKDSPLMKRFDFIKQLGYELIAPHLQRRLQDTMNLPKELRANIENVLREAETCRTERQQQQQHQPRNLDEHQVGTNN